MQGELFDTPFEKAQKEYEMALTKATWADIALNDARRKRNELCPHTEIEKKSSYFSGSYYDRAYTDYWNECKCCGAKSKVNTHMHSYYG